MSKAPTATNEVITVEAWVSANVATPALHQFWFLVQPAQLDAQATGEWHVLVETAYSTELNDFRRLSVCIWDADMAGEDRCPLCAD